MTGQRARATATKGKLFRRKPASGLQFFAALGEQLVPYTGAQSEQVAFDLLDLYDDAAEFVELLDAAVVGKPLSPASFEKLRYFVVTHWPIHLRSLRKVLAPRTTIPPKRRRR